MAPRNCIQRCTCKTTHEYVAKSISCEKKRDKIKIEKQSHSFTEVTFAIWWLISLRNFSISIQQKNYSRNYIYYTSPFHVSINEYDKFED